MEKARTRATALAPSWRWTAARSGRLICASKEQVRDVAGEESEWWLPESDLGLLRLNPEDAPAAAFRPRDDAPQLAFRPPGVPAEATDRSALDELSSRAQGSNDPLAILDAAGQPLPLLPSTSLPPTPTVTPLMIVPQTPRSSRRSSSIPRTPTSTRTRGRSKTPPRLQHAPLPPVPEEHGQRPTLELPVLPPEDQPGASRQTTSGASSVPTLPHQDQPGASRQTTSGASSVPTLPHQDQPGASGQTTPLNMSPIRYLLQALRLCFVLIAVNNIASFWTARMCVHVAQVRVPRPHLCKLKVGSMK